MKNIIILSLLCTVQAYAELPDFFCKSQVVNQVSKKIAFNNLSWARQRNDDRGVKTYRSQVQFNQWFELKMDEKLPPQLTFFNDKEYTDYKWNSSCRMNVSTGFVDLFPKKSSYKIDDFNNEDLKKLVLSGKSGVIYLYSPMMTYSITEFVRLKKSIVKQGYQFTSLLDPGVDPRLAVSAAKKLNLEFQSRRMASLDLYMMNAMDHFPTFFFYSNKKLYPYKLSGIHDVKNMANLFKQWKAELK